MGATKSTKMIGNKRWRGSELILHTWYKTRKIEDCVGLTFAQTKQKHQTTESWTRIANELSKYCRGLWCRTSRESRILIRRWTFLPLRAVTCFDTVILKINQIELWTKYSRLWKSIEKSHAWRCAAAASSWSTSPKRRRRAEWDRGRMRGWWDRWGGRGRACSRSRRSTIDECSSSEKNYK